MEGRVFKSTGLWYEVIDKKGNRVKCRLRGKIKLQGLKVSNPIAVGDSVEFFIEDNEAETGVIKTILPRTNYIIRKATKKSKQSHILASNLDQAILMATVGSPKTSLGFIDRFLVTAESFRIPVTILYNKSDLLNQEAIENVEKLGQLYSKLGYESYLISVLENTSLPLIENILKGKTSLIAGHSGVGKSSLLNQLAPHLKLKTAEISKFADKGVHTTTFAEMFEIANDTFLVDTPGIKELGLFDIRPEEIAHYFPEMRDLLGQCKFHNCTHMHEPECAIKNAITNGLIADSRYASYFSMYNGNENFR